MITSNDFNYYENYKPISDFDYYYNPDFSEFGNIVRCTNTNYRDIITAYSNAITNYIKPILFKIPNVTEKEINDFSYFTTDILTMLVSRIEASLRAQDNNTSALAENIFRLSYNESRRDFAKHSEVQNMCESLRNQLIKDFDDKIKTILEHEIQSDKSNTELLGILFPEGNKDVGV